MYPDGHDVAQQCLAHITKHPYVRVINNVTANKVCYSSRGSSPQHSISACRVLAFV